MSLTLGMVGLGIMGKPMANNLLRAGYTLVVHNRSRSAVETLVAEGARDGHSPKGVAEQSDVVITCLPDSPDVQVVALGPDGLIEGFGRGDVFIDMSTISPATARQVGKALEEKGVEVLDAPISGGEEGAIRATLSIMVGGKPEVFERCLDIFKVLGENVTLLGSLGAGQTTKAVNQIITAVTLEAVAEGLTLAVKSGLDPHKVIEAIKGGAAGSWMLSNRGGKMVSRETTPGFKISLHYKDLCIADEAAQAASVELPACSLVKEFYRTLCDRGDGDLDHSALFKLIGDL